METFYLVERRHRGRFILVSNSRFTIKEWREKYLYDDLRTEKKREKSKVEFSKE